MASVVGIKYDYSDVPTVAKFAGSNAFIRGLMGPFRSGKSSGCVVEIVRRAISQRPSPDGIRRTRWLVVRNCFDDQTEILTEKRGWQFFKNLKPDDRVASLRKGKELFYDDVIGHYAHHYSGEMIGFASEGADFLVTPDHNLWTSKRPTNSSPWQPYKHEKAEAAYGHHLRRFKRNAEWLGGTGAFSVDFFEFLGFWFAEGYAGAYQYSDRKEPHYRFVVVQKKNIPYVRDLLIRCGLSWGEDKRKCGTIAFRVHITPGLKPLIRELAGLGHAHLKYLPNWIKDCPSAHAAAFIKGYITGDGNFKTGPHSTSRASTTSKNLADDLQELALKAGMVANVGKSRIGKTTFKSNSEFAYRISFLQPSRYEAGTQRGWYKKQYDGTVYCVEVPEHTVYVRRNGKAIWSGQTFGQLEDSTIRTFLMWLPPQNFGRYFESDHTYLIKGFQGCDIEILFRALDRPEHVKNLLSLEVTGAWVNEAREVPWPIIDAIQGRVGQYPQKNLGGPSWYGLFMDTNPPDVDSKWYKFFEETKHDPKFAQIFKQPSGRGPSAENLSNLTTPTYYTNLAQGKSSEYVKVYIDGEYGYVIDGRPVYSDYKDQVHCKSLDPVKGVPIYRGWDFGLTPACVFSQVLPDGRWLIFDEIVSDRMGIDRFSDEVIEHCSQVFPKGADFIDVGDPAGESKAQTDEKTCFDILQAKGIMIEGGIQTLAIRLESVRKTLTTLRDGEPQFIIHPRCKMLRKGFQGAYQFRRLQVAAERYTNQPDKNPYSHPHDALQYVATRLFGGGLTMRREEDMDGMFGMGYHEDDRGRSEYTGY